MKQTESTVNKNKRDFLIEMALTSAINASVKENRVYVTKGDKTTSQNKITTIRVWKSNLQTIAQKYCDSHNIKDSSSFVSDVLLLQKSINDNDQLRHCFVKVDKNGNVISNRNGIRIAQCQKSLSMYLKYLWCYNLTDGLVPPFCPIDSVVLSECKSIIKNKGEMTKKRKELCNTKWTRLDSKKEYRDLINLVKYSANLDGFDSVAEWELKVWNERHNICDK